MRCKPGDLAVVVKSKVTSRLGLIVHVIKPATDGSIGYWDVTVDHLPCPHPLGWKVADAALRPIRPQPDDAVDEVIQRIGTPNKEIA